MVKDENARAAMAHRKEESDNVVDFKNSLKDLTFNSKPHISMLTMLADDADSSTSTDIARCIEQRLREVSNDKKMPLLYLIDSICKIVKRDVYVKYFSQNIVTTFCHVFEKADEKTRLSLYKLRQTWKGIFPDGKLFALDKRVKKDFDPAWPLSKPDITTATGRTSTATIKTEGSKVGQVHINPKFISNAKAQPAAVAPSDVAQLMLRTNELMEIQKQKADLEIQKARAEVEVLKRRLEEETETRKDPRSKPPPKAAPSDPRAKRPRQARKTESVESPSPKKKPPNWSGGDPRKNPQLNSRVQAKAVLDSIRPVPRKPRDFAPATQVDVLQAIVPVPLTTVAPSVSHVSSVHPSFDQPPITSIGNGQPLNTSIAGGSRVVMAPLGQDRDYRHEFEAIKGEADRQMSSGMMSADDHNKLLQKMRAMQQSIDRPIDARPEQTMLVDGKPRKLYYLDESTAIILMNAPLTATFAELIKADPNELDPRHIGFEGMPTKVFIDSDKGSTEFIQLGFNNPQPQTFFHGGNPQSIKFGGPAREIVLNGRTYQAKFGGPAIQVTFNGDHQVLGHTLRLDGPPPRVKLSDVSRADLWNQLVYQAMNPAPPPVAPVSAPPPAPILVTNPAKNVNDLFNSLVNAGFINKKPEPSVLNTFQVITGPREHLRGPDVRRSPIPPTHYSPVQRFDEDSQGPSQFGHHNMPKEPRLVLNADSLKVTRPSLWASLYSGIQCTNCSLRFDNEKSATSGSKTKYSKHLDWHFRQKRKQSSKPSASSANLKRSWYYTLDLWCQFKEVADEEDTGLANAFDTDSKDDQDSTEIEESTISASSDDALNECAVCGERFEQHWHQEDEEWKLKNATVFEEKFYHPMCLADGIREPSSFLDVSGILSSNTEAEQTDISDKIGGEPAQDEFDPLQPIEPKLENDIEMATLPDESDIFNPDGEHKDNLSEVAEAQLMEEMETPVTDSTPAIPDTDQDELRDELEEESSALESEILADVALDEPEEAEQVKMHVFVKSEAELVVKKEPDVSDEETGMESIENELPVAPEVGLDGAENCNVVVRGREESALCVIM